jgi:UDP-GlcNAc:undecaprenyl-phosphate GlcNAc-1-phosphate transferase
VTTLLAGLLQGNLPLVLATAPLAGALLGFLRYNFSPASIFLGDCGSLFIGFTLGCYGVIWSQKSATLLGMTAPLMVLIIPLLDTVLAVIRRGLRGQPIFGGDRNHIHHRLQARGLSPRHIALHCYAVCTIAAMFSLLQSVAHNRFAGLIIIVFCVATWIGVQHLGYAEFRTVRKLLLQGTFGHILDTQISVSTFEEEIAKAQGLDEHWRIIRDASRKFGFTHVRLRLGGNTFDESVKSVNGSPSWALRIPISDTEYVNLTRECDLSRGPTLMPTQFAEALQRCLSARALRLEAAAAQTPVLQGPPKQAA